MFLVKPSQLNLVDKMVDNSTKLICNNETLVNSNAKLININENLSGQMIEVNRLLVDIVKKK